MPEIPATSTLSPTDLPAESVAPSSAGVQTDATVGPESSGAQTPPSPDSFSYENLQPADGVSFASADWDTFKRLAAELKLSPEQIEKLVAFEASCAQRKTQAELDEKHQQSATWAQQTRALYGAGLEQEIAFALRAANTFGGPELRTLLEETGLGNHPVIIRTLSGIGRTISEDASAGGVPSAPQDKTFAQALYGKRN